jgi:hypothetical protein
MSRLRWYSEEEEEEEEEEKGLLRRGMNLDVLSKASWFCELVL